MKTLIASNLADFVKAAQIQVYPDRAVLGVTTNGGYYVTAHFTERQAKREFSRHFGQTEGSGQRTKWSEAA